MKKLHFTDPLVKLILAGEKTTTWRINDEKDIAVGDELSLRNSKQDEFARVKVISVKETTFEKLLPEDKDTHEKFKSDEEMYQTYSRYYDIVVTPKTEIKVIRFKIMS